MALKKDKNKAIAYRFVLYKIKELIADDRGRPRYINYFDNVFEDIFGIEHFAKKISSRRDDRDIVEILDRVGVEYLLRITNNSKNYNALEELVLINIRIQALKKSIKKQSEKGKRNDNDLKEYKYITDLYKKGTKALRKRIGVKNHRTEYKRRYRALNDLTKGNYDDDFSNIFLRDNSSFDPYDDDYDYDPYYDDDDYDGYRDTTALEDFERQLNQRHEKKSQPRERRHSSDRSMSILDDEYGDYHLGNNEGSDAEDAYENDERFDEIQDQIDKLAEVIMVQSESVQALINRDQCVQVAKPKKTNKVMELEEYLNQSSQEDDKPSETEILTGLFPKIVKDLGEIKKNQNQMGKILMNVCEWKKDMEQLMAEITEEDGDYADDVSFSEPEVSNGLYDTINKYPDAYTDDSESPKADPNAMTREELINKINESDDDNTSKEPTQPV